MLEYRNQVFLGNCLDVLKKLPDNVVDSCISDVPYGLGNKEPTPAQILAYLQGADLDTGGDFKGKKWQIPSVPVWNEVFRVLKPGAFVVIFGGTRTFDLIGMGIRMAGFWSCDTLFRNYPLLQWVQGMGMPKTHNASKALEKKGDLEGAAKAKGLGSGLKPAVEPIMIFQKPFEGTIADNFLKYGTGLWNIDGCRVRHANQADYETHKAQVEEIKRKGGVRGNSWKNSSDLSGANDVSTAGRWPANFLLEHFHSCKQVGTKVVAPHPQGPERFQKTSGGDFSTAYGNQLAQAETEILPVYNCVEGCPVALLDEQSGDRPSTLTGRADPSCSHEHPGTEMGSKSGFLGERTHLSTVYADAGGASRFFNKFEPDDVPPFFFAAKVSKKEATLDGQIENDHVSKKPVALMRFLVRLANPVKKGLVLDPYCGSGSTLHAAVLEGMDFIGIEWEAPSHKTASERVAIVLKEQTLKTTQDELLDLAMGQDGS